VVLVIALPARRLRVLDPLPASDLFALAEVKVPVGRALFVFIHLVAGVVGPLARVLAVQRRINEPLDAIRLLALFEGAEPLRGAVVLGGELLARVVGMIAAVAAGVGVAPGLAVGVSTFVELLVPTPRALVLMRVRKDLTGAPRVFALIAMVVIDRIPTVPTSRSFALVPQVPPWPAASCQLEMGQFPTIFVRVGTLVAGRLGAGENERCQGGRGGEEKCRQMHNAVL